MQGHVFIFIAEGLSIKLNNQIQKNLEGDSLEP
jgi:hypothetical protein